MKYLSYFIIFIIGLSVLLIAIGLLNPSVKYGHEITVNKPIKEAWAVLQDYSKFDQWLKGFKSIDLISGQPGVVGSKYKVVVNPEEGQPDFEMIETIVSIKEFDHVDLSFDSEMMVFDQKTTLVESNGKTTIKTESEVVGKGFMMRTMFALMELLGGSFQAQEEKNIEALKRVIEENTTDYYPAPALESGEDTPIIDTTSK